MGIGQLGLRTKNALNNTNILFQTGWDNKPSEPLAKGWVNYQIDNVDEQHWASIEEAWGAPEQRSSEWSKDELRTAAQRWAWGRGAEARSGNAVEHALSWWCLNWKPTMMHTCLRSVYHRLFLSFLLPVPTPHSTHDMNKWMISSPFLCTY